MALGVPRIDDIQEVLNERLVKGIELLEPLLGTWHPRRKSVLSALNNVSCAAHPPDHPAQHPRIGLLAQPEIVLPIPWLRGSHDDTQILQQPRVGADARATNAQSLSQLCQTERALMHDHEAHNVAGDTGETLRLDDQAHLLDEFRDRFVCLVCHPEQLFRSVRSVKTEQTIWRTRRPGATGKGDREVTLWPSYRKAFHGTAQLASWLVYSPLASL